MRPTLVLALGLFAACGHHTNGHGGADSGTVADSAADSGCGLTSCAAQNAQCGLIGDGCGGTIDCGGCPMGETCGGGGTLFQCGTGSGSCTARTCMQAGATCGKVGDGCGGLTPDCGSCTFPETCGGGGTANVCGCTNLCSQINACTGMTPTSIDGFISAPGHAAGTGWNNWVPDPIYGALVYIPNSTNGALDPLPDGVAGANACPQCADLVSGNPLIVATTDSTGYFKLDNVPCGTNIPVVFQLGKWRREVFLPSVACCANTRLTDDQRHLPRNHTEGNIPLTAIATGHVDDIECTLRKIGIDDAEFTNPSGAGRVVFYQNNGARIDATTPAASSLYTSATELAKHDVTIMACEGGENQTEQGDTASQQRFVDYSNAGGRVFATHFSYVWLTNDNLGGTQQNTGPAPYSQTATWDVNKHTNDNTFSAFVDTTLQGDMLTQQRRVAFAQWLVNIGASATLGRVPVGVVRQDFDVVNQRAQQWVYFDHTADSTNPWTAPLHYTFDMPVTFPPNPPPQKECGRVLYSDFHVENASVSTTTNFPGECTKTALTPQEQTLEFMMFDLASCVGPPQQTCTALTCAQQNFNCGLQGDGCGGTIDCGMCPMGQTCGGGGAGVCGGGSCTPQTCQQAGAQCGVIGDGCGATVDCGQCSPPLTCGGGGQANQCGGVF